MELALFVIKSHQVDKLVAFYRQFGLDFIEEKHGKGPIHFSAYLTTILFEIYPLSSLENVVDTTTRLGFKIDNLENTFQLLKEHGVSITSEPKQTQWGYLAVVKDPDGRTVELYQK